MTKIKKIIFSILYLLILLYLIAFVPILWNKKPLVVVSGSMENTLKVGSIVYYKDKNFTLNKDDILVYKTKYHIVSHRIVNITKDGIITKGDANQSSDSKKVVQEQIMGKANNWCIPYYGYYVDFIYRHKILLYFTITLLLLDLVIEFYKERKGLNDKEKKNN